MRPERAHISRVTGAGALLTLVLCLLILMPFTVQARQKVYLTNGEWPPYLSEKLPHYGFASHIVTEAFAAVDIDVEYGFFPWSRSYFYARNGRDPNNKVWNGTLVWVPTEERQKLFYYSDSVVSDDRVFFHLEDNPLTWAQFDDLKGKIIGGTQHTSYPFLEELAHRGVIKLEKKGDYETLFRRLLLRRIDAVPHVRRVAEYFLRTSLSAEQRNRITASPTVIDTLHYHLILNRKNPDNEQLTELFNQGLQIIKNNGVYDALLHHLHNGDYDHPQ